MVRHAVGPPICSALESGPFGDSILWRSPGTGFPSPKSVAILPRHEAHKAHFRYQHLQVQLAPNAEMLKKKMKNYDTEAASQTQSRQSPYPTTPRSAIQFKIENTFSQQLREQRSDHAKSYHSQFGQAIVAPPDLLVQPHRRLRSSACRASGGRSDGTIT